MVQINVTASHIAVGSRHSCQTCPIALAVSEVLHAPPYFASVSPTSVVVDVIPGRGVDFEARSLRLSPAVQRFIDAFDDERPVSPFSFELDIPEACCRVRV